MIKLKSIVFLGILTMAISSCLKDPVNPDPVDKPARAQIEITDAPIDEPNIEGVFVTVADIKIDGVSWTGFKGKTTFDLLAYQKGQTKLLGDGDLAADTYHEIILILDTDTDAHGSSPGCYVLDNKGNKSKLEGGNNMTLKATGVFSTETNKTTNVVVDVDLRKSIVNKPGSATEFQFVTFPELYTSVRMMDKAATGNILGDCIDGVSNSKKIIVYAYKVGEYTTNEKFPQGTSQVYFKNAVCSSAVGEDGSYNLAFLQNGNYELHFISYQEDAQGKLVAKGELQLTLLDSVLNLLNLQVVAGQELRVNMTVSGIVFF